MFKENIMCSLCTLGSIHKGLNRDITHLDYFDSFLILNICNTRTISTVVTGNFHLEFYQITSSLKLEASDMHLASLGTDFQTQFLPTEVHHLALSTHYTQKQISFLTLLHGHEQLVCLPSLDPRKTSVCTAIIPDRSHLQPSCYIPLVWLCCFFQMGKYLD